jgi:hypothetical protein
MSSRWIAPPATWNAAQATSQQIANTKKSARKIESARNRIVKPSSLNNSTARSKSAVSSQFEFGEATARVILVTSLSPR